MFGLLRLLCVSCVDVECLFELMLLLFMCELWCLFNVWFKVELCVMLCYLIVDDFF